jgi:hypothetical protein
MTNQEPTMDLITRTHVDYRQHELRDVASSLRWERGRPSSRWRRTVRLALGRRLVLAGNALLGETRRPVATAR